LAVQVPRLTAGIFIAVFGYLPERIPNPAEAFGARERGAWPGMDRIHGQRSADQQQAVDGFSSRDGHE